MDGAIDPAAVAPPDLSARDLHYGDCFWRFMRAPIPTATKGLILATIRHPSATPDHILIIADGLDEVATLRRVDGLDAQACRDAASALRDVAGELAR